MKSCYLTLKLFRNYCLTKKYNVAFGRAVLCHGTILICYVWNMEGFVCLLECIVWPWWVLATGQDLVGTGRKWSGEAASGAVALPSLCSQLTAQEVLLTRAMAQAGSHDRCLGKEASSRDKHGVGKTKAIAVNPLYWDQCEFTLISLMYFRMWQQKIHNLKLGDQFGNWLGFNWF